MRRQLIAVACLLLEYLAATSALCIDCVYLLNTTTTTSGNGASYDSPRDMTDQCVCNWTFTGNDTNGIVYIFVDMLDLGDSATLTIHDGQTPFELTPDELIAPMALALNASDSSIQIHSTRSLKPEPPPLRRISFKWQTTESSPVLLTDFKGIIESPKYLQKTGAKPLSISWVITGSSGMGIALAFEKLNLGNGSLILEPAGLSLVNLTGSTLPPDKVMKTYNLKITLNLPTDEANLGFIADYTLVYPVCSAEVNINSTQTFLLEPLQFKLPVKCVWIFKGPVDSSLSVTVVRVDSPVNASNSHLVVNDGGSMFSNNIGLFSSSAFPINQTMLSSGNQLYVAYSYHDVNVANVTLNVSMNNHGGNLRDSGYFGIKPALENTTIVSNTSVWSLVVDPDMQVRVDLQSFVGDIDDRVTFYEDNAANRKIATLYANSTLIPIESSRNSMFVVAENFRGNSTFSATFKGSSSKSYILSTHPHGSNQIDTVDGKSNFTWNILPVNSNASDIISLKFSELLVTPNVSSVLIYEGQKTSGSPLASVTTSTSDFTIHVSASQGAAIVYNNVGEKPINGVLLDAYYNVKPSCSQEWNVTVGEGRVTSPSYPNSYPVDADCTYTLMTSPNKSLLLSFEDVNLADGHFLALMNDTIPVLNLTSNAMPDDYISSKGAKLLIKFVTNSMPTNITRGRGFSIRVIALDCGSHINETQNSLMVPNWPDPLKNSTLCVWSIALPHSKQVNIISVDVESTPVPSSPAILKFVDGGVLNAGLNSDVINSTTTNYLSRTSKLTIVYNYTQVDPKVLGSSFKLSYSTKECPSSELCKNGVCMHANWKCNGIDDCGDFTDEYNCTAGNIIIQSNEGVGVATFVLFIFIMFFTGAAVALAAPTLYRRFRSPRHYQSFGGAIDT